MKKSIIYLKGKINELIAPIFIIGEEYNIFQNKINNIKGDNIGAIDIITIITGGSKEA